MARKRLGVVLLATVTILVASAVAQQSNEIAGVIGRSFISSQSVSGAASKLHFGNGPTYEANYSHKFIGLGLLGVSVEVPFVFNSSTKLNFGSLNAVPRDFSAYFITPAARVTLFPTTAFNPWVSVGGGFAHFSPNSTLEFGGPNPTPGTKNSGVFEVGVGLDVRILGPFRLRGELRDFNTNEAPVNINVNSRYSHLFAGAGVVFAF